MFRFAQTTNASVQIRLGPSSNIPEVAVAYSGKLLTLPRKLYQGFTPINYGRIAKVTNGRSEAGNFLGRIVMQEFVKDSVPLSLIDPAYLSRIHFRLFDRQQRKSVFHRLAAATLSVRNRLLPHDQ